MIARRGLHQNIVKKRLKLSEGRGAYGMHRRQSAGGASVAAPANHCLVDQNSETSLEIGSL
jgi:hypothetical protein